MKYIHEGKTSEFNLIKFVEKDITGNIYVDIEFDYHVNGFAYSFKDNLKKEIFFYYDVSKKYFIFISEDEDGSQTQFTYKNNICELDIRLDNKGNIIHYDGPIPKKQPMIYKF